MVGRNGLLHLLVPMLLPNLVDRHCWHSEDHELGRAAGHPPAGIVRLDPLGLRHARAHGLVGVVHWSSCLVQRVQRHGALGRAHPCQPGQNARQPAHQQAIRAVSASGG